MRSTLRLQGTSWREALGALVAVGIGALVAADLAAAQEPKQSDHSDHDHRFVRITASRLQPVVQKVSADEAIGWVNYSSQLARISFAKDVAKHMTCISKASFRVTGERLESNDIQGRQFASLCRLDAGEYPYQVRLHSGAGVSTGTFSPRTLEGRIVVEE